ncbi:hypothetical protein KAI87_14610 [Myxococcota bacterium]|nr:hypothetical protein [Myxococcota bacterium]
MSNENKVQLFQEQSVRTHWDEQEEKWYFSVMDVVAVLTESKDPAVYWRKLKQRLKAEGNQTVTDCHGLKMLAKDGRMRKTDVADAEQILRLIQSVPSPKAEPFKRWLAKVGAERIDEIEDPELAFDRAMQTYLVKGYSKEWINQRLKSIEVRKELTDEWSERGMRQGLEYAILTNELTKAWAGKDVREYKQHKGLKKENLRDNMSNLELVLNMLAEASTTEISKEKQPKGLTENKDIARKGGNAAKQARLEIEKQTGKSIVSAKNAEALLLRLNNEKIVNGRNALGTDDMSQEKIRNPLEIYTLTIELESGMYAEDDWKRVIEIPAGSDLDDLHAYIQEIVGFANDHMFEFFAGRDSRHRKRVFGDDEEEGLETMLFEVYPLNKLRLFYYFDFGDSWTFSIKKGRKKKSVENGVDYPRVIEFEGENPEQYPAY